MTAMALSAPPSRLWRDAPVFTGLSVFLAISALPVWLALYLDPRAWLDEAIWLKPLKFQIALVIYLLTLAFFARFLPAGTTDSRAWRIYAAAVAFTVIGEMVWIGGAAAMGTASHFNVTTPLWNAIYGLMGLFAAFLTSASFVMAILIRRNMITGLDPALKLSIVLGLGLTLPLTLIVAFTMAAGSGHLIGTPVTGLRLPLMGWSREVGDLRIAHFLGTHALHAVPLVGWLVAGRLPAPLARTVVILAAVAWVALTFGTFALALAGKPLI